MDVLFIVGTGRGVVTSNTDGLTSGRSNDETVVTQVEYHFQGLAGCSDGDVSQEEKEVAEGNLSAVIQDLHGQRFI